MFDTVRRSVKGCKVQNRYTSFPRPNCKHGDAAVPDNVFRHAAQKQVHETRSPVCSRDDHLAIELRGAVDKDWTRRAFPNVYLGYLAPVSASVEDVDDVK
jgi:hypothetical protein